MEHFKYLRWVISYYTQEILYKFQFICGTINRTLKDKTRKDTKLQFYILLAIPTLLYNSGSRHQQDTGSLDDIFM
jgi:hypothetical protein